MDRRLFNKGLVTSSLGLVLPNASFGQTWPESRVNIIVPFPAGAATDITGRVIAAKLSQMWGQAVTIDNRGGGNANYPLSIYFYNTPPLLGCFL